MSTFKNISNEYIIPVVGKNSAEKSLIDSNCNNSKSSEIFRNGPLNNSYFSNQTKINMNEESHTSSGNCELNVSELKASKSYKNSTYETNNSVTNLPKTNVSDMTKTSTKNIENQTKSAKMKSNLNEVQLTDDYHISLKSLGEILGTNIDSEYFETEVQKHYSFKIDSRKWEDMYKRRNRSTKCLPEGEWQEIMLEGLKSENNLCVFKFKRHRANDGNKIGSTKFNAQATCVLRIVG